MAQASKVPVTTEKAAEPTALAAWRPFESLHREIDRLFEDFGRSLWPSPFRRSLFEMEPFWRREAAWEPEVDIIEKNGAYEVIAELPGIDEKNIEVKLSNGNLFIKGEKQEEKEAKEKGYYLHERHFGSFERCFRVPEGVDTDKIEATFKKGVLTLTLPKTPEAMKAEKKIAVKAA